MTHCCRTLLVGVALLLAACAQSPQPVAPARDYYGTLEPFASEAVYFVVTDRFVDGDVSNNHESQGGAQLGTFDRPIQLEGKLPANIGYLGGDFRGIVENAGYITDTGFTALWLTPIVENPDEAFTGSTRPGEGVFADRGKTGYHGYWGVNFFVVDEHLESDGLAFADFTEALDRAGLKTVLDVVCNHGSPAYTMPEDQPLYGEIYDADGTLLADHENLHPTELDPANPLHAFYRREPDLAQLSDMDWDNPDVLDYFVAAYSQWMDQGAAAFRIDTIKHMPHEYWAKFSDRIREKKPDFFMFAEAYAFDASEIASYTWTENGRISVLDFPGKASMNTVFADGGPYSALEDYLHLESRLYDNAYELMTFYDNHDMPRMDAGEDGFVDAHNWIFTSRGIPVIYYGSEIGFRAGTGEHGGNRDYFGQDNVDAAKSHRVRKQLKRIANVRKDTVALQRGLHLNVSLGQDTAAFYRVYQYDGVSQTALVVLNKSDESAVVDISLDSGIREWADVLSDTPYTLGRDNHGLLRLPVDAHGVRVLVSDQSVSDSRMIAELDRLQANRERL